MVYALALAPFAAPWVLLQGSCAASLVQSNFASSLRIAILETIANVTPCTRALQAAVRLSDWQWENR